MKKKDIYSQKFINELNRMEKIFDEQIDLSEQIEYIYKGKGKFGCYDNEKKLQEILIRVDMDKAKQSVLNRLEFIERFQNSFEITLELEKVLNRFKYEPYYDDYKRIKKDLEEGNYKEYKYEEAYANTINISTEKKIFHFVCLVYRYRHDKLFLRAFDNKIIINSKDAACKSSIENWEEKFYGAYVKWKNYRKKGVQKKEVTPLT
ncbi:MAG: hypothetical protein M3R36_05975 [Bacteroidota bacterium]|nr:hypothetical protein [Bacteroidota bacterium]